MFCPNCGNQIQENSVFCGSCGTRLQLSAPEKQEETVIPVEPVVPAPAPQPEPLVAPAPQPEPPVAPVPQPEPPVAPAPQPARPAAPATRVKKDRGPLLKRIGLMLLLAVLYAGTALLFFLLLQMEETIALQTLFDSDVFGYMTLQEFLSLLINGNRVFYPTVVSIAFGVGMYVLIWAVPFFAALALIGAVTGKGTGRLYAASAVVSVLTALLTAAIVPVSMWLIPGLRQAAAVAGGVIFADLDTVKFTMLLIFGAAALVLVVAAGIVTAVLNKRRA